MCLIINVNDLSKLVMYNLYKQRDRKRGEKATDKAAHMRRHIDPPVEEAVHEIDDDAKQDVLKSRPRQEAVHRGDKIRPEQAEHSAGGPRRNTAASPHFPEELREKTAGKSRHKIDKKEPLLPEDRLNPRAEAVQGPDVANEVHAAEMHEHARQIPPALARRHAAVQRAEASRNGCFLAPARRRLHQKDDDIHSH